MRYPAFVLSGLVLLAACTDRQALIPTAEDAAPAAAASASAAEQIKDSYIVVLKPGVNARGVAAAVSASPRFVYGSLLNGFAAKLNTGQLNALRHNPNVLWIEPDQVGTVATTQTSPPWGLDRIDERTMPVSGTYTYTTTASNVHVYILDTGIYTSHPEFEGRADNTAFDPIGNPGSGTDCNGHGTHVAGIAGSKTYGVAKKVRLHGVRVAGCNGSVTTAAMIAGLEYVQDNHIAPAVANISIEFPASNTLDNAVDSLAHRRVFVAVAAGNADPFTGITRDACTISPARAPTAFTVAASNRFDERSGSSNWGTCVDIYAPGVGIVSTWNNGGTLGKDGTSMAAPHVAGVAALYKATYGNVTTNTIHTWLRQNATVNTVINGSRNGTPNYLLFKSTL